MIFKNENAVMHGSGDAVSRTFTREDSKVFQAGCRLASVHNKVAKDILFVGGVAEASEVDALDEQTVDGRV